MADSAEAKLKVVAVKQLRKEGLTGKLSIRHACGTAKALECYVTHNSVPFRAALLEGELVEFELLSKTKKKK